MYLPSDVHFAKELKLSGRGGEFIISEYFQLYLFIFNIKKLTPKKEHLGWFELSGWQGFCATAFFC